MPSPRRRTAVRPGNAGHVNDSSSGVAAISSANRHTVPENSVVASCSSRG